MRQIQGHYGGSTWAGATHPAGVSATADAALVAPAHVLPEAKASTEAGPNLYLLWTETSTAFGPEQVRT